MNNLPKLDLPESLNYIGVFFTMSCNLSCVYCVNIPDSNQALTNRESIFPIASAKSNKGMSPQQWVMALNRIPNREDLPISAQGGESTLFNGGKGLAEIFKGVDHYFDLLTNMASLSFYKTIEGQQHKLQRKAPYPSIRVSYHQAEMDRVWHGKGFEELVRRCEALRDYGFVVSPDKKVSDVGIYMVNFPTNLTPPDWMWRNKVPFETKEFLGVHEGELYGTYAYQHSTDLISRGIWHETLSCECKTSELLVDPNGFVHSCHQHLYEVWAKGGTTKEFSLLAALNFEFKKFSHNLFSPDSVKPIGHILDAEFVMEDLNQFRVCHDYGKCSGCDVKSKNSRHQSLDDKGIAHTSVTIRNVKWPEGIKL